MLLLSRFSRVQLCATPQMAAHQAPPSLGFSRQEHWSGLPLPSPMHESEKRKGSRSVSVRLFMTPWTAAYQAPPSMGFSRQEYWSGVPLTPHLFCYVPCNQFSVLYVLQLKYIEYFLLSDHILADAVPRLYEVISVDQTLISVLKILLHLVLTTHLTL